MKKIIFILIIIIASFSILNSINSIYSLWKKQDVLISAKKELQKDEKKNQELKKELSVASSGQYVEQVARDKLFMSKPGEDTIYIPKDMLATGSAQAITPTPVPNWQQWWKLFF